jgi:hypothetical protein
LVGLPWHLAYKKPLKSIESIGIYPYTIIRKIDENEEINSVITDPKTKLFIGSNYQ